jgi:hypothetical protein
MALEAVTEYGRLIQLLLFITKEAFHTLETIHSSAVH